MYNIIMNHQKGKVVSDYIYSPTDILGTGTWGSVFLAEHRQSGCQYALKKMNKFKVQASQQTFLKYRSQVETLRKAGEIPQVIRIIDFFKTMYNYYIVTEYFPDSKDLYQYMLEHKNKFCEQQARQIWKDLLLGIFSLHSMGILHRDLKLQNIVYLFKERQAKIIDFGMATCFPSPQGGMVGSPMFMSPQVLNNQKYTYKCDLWSLGIIFYCMVCRTSPYGEHNNAKAIQQKMKDIKQKGLSYPNQVYISRPCKDVIQACLQYQQKHRRSVQQLLAMPFFAQQQITERDLDYFQPSTTFKP